MLRYQQIANYFAKGITDKAYAAGEKLPTEAEICKMFQVSRITVRHAMDELVQRGAVYRKQGKGSFVSHHRADMQLNHLIGFSEEMRQLGMTASTKVINSGIIEPSEDVRLALKLESGQQIQYFKRLRLANGLPMAIERAHLPFYRFFDLDTQDLTKSLYRLAKEKYNCHPHLGQQQISATLPTADDAELLQIDVQTPVLHIIRTTLESYGEPFEYVLSTYRGDMYSFNVSLAERTM